MKKLFFASLLLFLSRGAHATPASISEGQVIFAAQDSQGNLLTPTNWEVNLSTCLVIVIDGKIELGFDSYQDWIDCQTKAGLKRKIRKIRQLIDSMSDLPLVDSKDLKERAGWIKSYYQTLP